MSFDVPVPRLLQRGPNRVSLSMPSNSNYDRYRVRGHRTLDGAFNSPVTMFEVKDGRAYFSPSIRKSGVGILNRSIKGQTRMLFDPNDFKNPTKTPGSEDLPLDSDFLFLVVEPYSKASGSFLTGTPISVIPHPSFSGIQDAAMTLSGTAPGVTAIIGEKPPSTALNFYIPIYSGSMTLHNNDAAETLLFSYGEGMPTAALTPNQGSVFISGRATEFFVASSSGTPISFSLVITVTTT